MRSTPRRSPSPPLRSSGEQRRRDPGLLHAVLPAGVDDPGRPSGGNHYDRRALDGLRQRGRTVVERTVAGAWPRPAPDDLARLDATLARVAGDSLVLVDGLVATGAGTVLAAHAGRLRFVVLLHLPVGPDHDEGEALHAAEAVVTTSAWARTRVQEWYDLRGVHVCRPGADRAPVARGSSAGGGTSFLCVAAVHPGKGHDVLLDALARLGDRAWTLTCAGSLEVDPDQVAALQTQVYARSWERRVIFTGPLTGAALDAAYDAADLVVLPSRFESYGMVVSEALARALPVVASAVGGVPEALGGAPVGALPGLLVEPADPAALTAALAAWLDDPALRERLGRFAERSRPLVRGWDAVAADLDDVLSAVEAATRSWPAGPCRRAAMSRAWPWLRLLGGVAVLAFLLRHFGTGPVAEAWRATTWQAVLAASVLTGLSTLTSAWRWRVVARSLGLPLSVRESVAAYYRSQFLNAVLPGGILGDADRAVRHGRAAGDLGAGVRATVWDRVSGQVVQVALTVLALVLLPTPWQGSGIDAAGVPALLGAAAAAALVVRRRTDVWLARDLRVLSRPAVLSRVVVASCGTTGGHLAVFAVAAFVVGVDTSPAVLVTTGLVVLVGSSIPLSIAGWGPREGVTAWAFGVVGLGAVAGLTVAVVYGVLAAIATLPGAVVLVADVVARRRLHVVVVEPEPDVVPVLVPEPVEARCA